MGVTDVHFTVSIPFITCKIKERQQVGCFSGTFGDDSSILRMLRL